MNIPPEIGYPITIAVVSGAGMWIKSVSERLAAHDAILSKLDRLIDLLMEDRLKDHTRA